MRESSNKDEMIIGFATSAVRESSNKDEIVERIKKETDVDVRVISGDQEGKITFAGSSTEFSKKILLMDIGGGSTEFIFGDREKIDYVKSFKVGAVRETKKYFQNDNYDDIKSCITYGRERISEIEKFRGQDFIFVGVAGTVTTNVSVYEEMKVYDSEKVHLYTLTKKNLKRNLDKFLSLIGLQPERGENIIAGTLIILEAMEILGKDEIVV